MINANLFIFLFVLWNVTADLQEGSPCMAAGYPGTCRHWKKCLTLVLDKRDKNYPPLCSRNRSGPVVCCTSCELSDDVSKVVINPRGLFLMKTNQKSWNQCINYYLELPYEFKEDQNGQIWKGWNETKSCFDIQFGIVAAAGGRDANRAEFPHMALLGYGSANTTSQWVCGGTVISDRFILTAGHCISSPYLGTLSYAALGILKRSDPEDLWQKYRIESIIPHPRYRPPSKYHDIALLKTMERIAFNENVMPACLPNLAKKADDGTAQATGWGTVGPKTSLADTLQSVNLVKFSHAKCSALFGHHRLLYSGINHQTQMCYGDHTKVKDTCEGDSGGPLQIRGQVFFNQKTVVGVTSYGPDCGFAGQAGVYTRVAPYVRWIDRIVWK